MTRQFNALTIRELNRITAKEAIVHAVNVFDTIDTCWETKTKDEVHEWTQHYIEGEYPPHYSVPAIGNELVLAHPVVLYGSANNLWAKQ